MLLFHELRIDLGTSLNFLIHLNGGHWHNRLELLALFHFVGLLSVNRFNLFNFIEQRLSDWNWSFF